MHKCTRITLFENGFWSKRVDMAGFLSVRFGAQMTFRALALRQSRLLYTKPHGRKIYHVNISTLVDQNPYSAYSPTHKTQFIRNSCITLDIKLRLWTIAVKLLRSNVVAIASKSGLQFSFFFNFIVLQSSLQTYVPKY